MRIEAYRDNTIYYCRFCHMCQHACTVANVTQNEADTTRGKLFTLFTVLAGSQSYNPEIARLLTRCTSCRLCKDWCYEHFDAAEVIEAARADLADAGMADPAADEVVRLVETSGNPFGAPAKEGMDLLAELGGAPKAGVLYFPGCTVLHRRPDAARAMARLFRAAGILFQVPREPTCCGAFLKELGFLTLAGELAAKNLAALKDSGAETVVFACPHCLKAFVEDYRRLGLEMPCHPRLIHQTEFVAELLADGRLKLGKGKLDGKAALHDSCVLGRQLGLYDPPRRIMQALGQTTELRWHKEKAHCCGAGGGMYFTNPAVAAKAARNRIDEAKAAGADLLMTACPLCLESLSADGSLRVADLVETLAGLVP